jgi:hypothetical protein
MVLKSRGMGACPHPALQTLGLLLSRGSRD